MSIKSSIEWTITSWNPITGCTPMSKGCEHCYALRMAKRLQAMGNYSYRNGFNVTLHNDRLPKPLQWKKPQIIFVNSMSDVFHDQVPFEFIEKIFSIMEQAHWHIFQILTKRSHRLLELAQRLKWPKNVWMGVTVESSEYLYRVDHLRNVPSAIRFLSLEPLLSPLDHLDLDQINWVIVGGESGPHARPMQKLWVENIHQLCLNAQVPFFFKQWGGTNKKRNGRILNGKTYSEHPQFE